MMDDDRKRQAALAHLLADWDGCEGGDMLRGLTELFIMAQDGHGYAMSDKTEAFIRQAVQSEIDAQLEWIDDTVVQGIRTQQEADELRVEIDRIQNGPVPDDAEWDR
jgi:hypothetical protein